MGNVKFSIIKDFGKLSASGDVFFRLIDWSGYKKYDLRKWDEEGKNPFKGITVDPDELDSFLELLVRAQKAEKNELPLYTVCLGKATARIMNVFGSFSERDDMAKQVCFVNWGRSGKYDIRPWNDGYTACGKGVTLNEPQLQKLIEAVSEAVEDEDTRYGI